MKEVDLKEAIIHAFEFEAAKKASRQLPSPKKSFFLNSIMKSEILNVGISLNMSSCCDYYDIKAKIIKSVNGIVDPLCSLYNSCLRNGNFPNAFKINVMLPIFKQWDIDKIDNFRPIAICKILIDNFKI